MKIGITKKQEPIYIHEFDNSELQGEKGLAYNFSKFKERKKLHNGLNLPIPNFTAYIDIMAWDAFLEFANKAYRNSKHEACGVIMGKYFKDENGEFIIGSQFEPGTGNSTSAVLCEISYEDNARIAKKYENLDFLPVIWIHSHPGYGIFYSGQDNETLREKYCEDFHLGIVVDNRQNDFGGYKMINKKIKEFDEIFLVNLESKEMICERPFGKIKTKNTIVKEESKSPEVEEKENSMDKIKEERVSKLDSISEESSKKKISLNRILLLVLTALGLLTNGILVYIIYLLKGNSKL